jgi:hypothetical protein
MLKNTTATRFLGTALIATVIAILAFASQREHSCPWNGTAPSYACATNR